MRGNRLHAFPNLENASLTLIQGNRCVYWSENRKILKFLPQNHISGGNFMRGINCTHSRSLKTLHWFWFREISACWIFASIHTLISLNHDQGSIFRNALNRFPTWNYPQKYDFEGEIWKFFDFRFNTHIYFPESGSRKHFHVSGMRAIDFRMILPLKMIFLEKFFTWISP